MQAIGNDGKWHEWEDLSAEEQAEWMRCMTKANKRRQDEYEVGRRMTLRETVREYEREREI